MSGVYRRWTWLLIAVAVVGAGAAGCQSRSAPKIVPLPLPADIEEVDLEQLGTARYVDPAPARDFCGSDVYSTYAGESVAHGLTASSGLPRELVKAVEELGWPIEEYEHRWFGKQRIVLFSASPNDETKPLFVDVMEIVLIEDESGEQTWSIPYRKLGRPCG